MGVALGAAILFYAAGYFLFRRRGFHYEPAALFLSNQSQFSAREEEGDAVYAVTPARPPLAPLALGAAALVAIVAAVWVFGGESRSAAGAAAIGAASWVFVFLSPFARRTAPRHPVDIAWVGESLAVGGRRWRREQIAAIAVRNAAPGNAARAIKACSFAVSLVEENGAETFLAGGLTQETAEALSAGLSAHIGVRAA